MNEYKNLISTSSYAGTYGAVIGDIYGSYYEFLHGPKTPKQEIAIHHSSRFTDDTVLTAAIASFLAKRDQHASIAATLQSWARKYPHAGFGGMFSEWIYEDDPKPYHSFGNGSAMRVSPVAYYASSLEECQQLAKEVTEVTHNHPEGIKGAESVASAIFMARNGKSKKEIKEYIVSEFGYNLSRTCDEIRPGYHHVESCQETVPEAMTAFLEGTDFEDVIRTAVSLGGDCDTLTCIAGSIAEAFYGVPKEMKAECRKRLPMDMLAVLDRFEEMR